jgi:hypothetical protein
VKVSLGLILVVSMVGWLRKLLLRFRFIGRHMAVSIVSVMAVKPIVLGLLMGSIGEIMLELLLLVLVKLLLGLLSSLMVIGFVVMIGVVLLFLVAKIVTG